MKVILTSHSKERMKKYYITSDMIKKCLTSPDSRLDTYMGRKIYQKKLNGHVLRVIVEEGKEIKRVITTYKSRSKRYGI